MRSAITLILTCCAIAIAGIGAGGQLDPSSARRALDDGRYAEAERRATAALGVAEQTFGADAAQTAAASDVVVEALLKNGKGGVTSTLSVAQRTVDLKARLTGANSPDTATSFNNLGAVQIERGEFASALNVLAKVVQIRRQTGANKSVLADGLENRAVALIRLERFGDAATDVNEVIKIREEGGSAKDRARALGLLALLRRYEGRYDQALKAVDESIALYRRSVSDHPDVLPNIQIRGELLLLTGQVGSARQVFADLLVQEERILGADHASVPRTLRWLALTSSSVGDLTEARLLLDRAAPIANRWLARCHPETTGLLNDRANVVMSDGDYASAQSLYERALSVRQSCLGRSHSLTATLVHNLALLAAESGDYSRSERLQRDAIGIWTSVLGPNHPYVGRGLDALAEVYLLQGRTADARRTYERALEIRQKSLGASNPDVAWTLTNLARTAVAAGDPVVGRRRVEQAIDIYKLGGLPQEPDHMSRALGLLGAIEMQRGDFPAARMTFTEALSLREKIFGPAHPLSAETRRDIATADFSEGSYGAAIRGALHAERTGRDHLQFTIRYLPERLAMAYADKRPRGLDLALSVVAAGEIFEVSRVFDSVIRSRGVILDELIARAQSTGSTEPELASLNAALTKARQRFANLMFRSLRGEDPVPQAVLDEARQEREDAERALAARSVATRRELARASFGLPDLRQELPEGAALVSFVRYDRTLVVARPSGRTTQVSPAYVAFVTTKDSDVRAISLGAASEIDRLVAAWQRVVRAGAFDSSRNAESEYRSIARELRSATWDKVAAELGTARTVLVVPDGMLSLVNFASLPDNGNGYLVDEQRVIHYLSTERDLLREEGSRGQGLLAVGGAAFDAEPRPSKSPAVRGGTCVAAKAVRFASLPGTLGELRDLAMLWPSAAGRGQLTILSGGDANETGVKQALTGRRIVHLATHGFFLGSGCDEKAANTRSVGGLVAASPSQPKTSVLAPTPSALLENPLLLSGLAFAGANRRSGSSGVQDDGILTAEEIAGLNLQGTEWAVLSACDTGIGTFRSGEGVFGLRRAFQIAGAHTVIMSLWSVDDQATRDWMRSLYNGRLREGRTTADAVRDASLSVLRDRRAKGQSTHPFLWAAFIAAGDWN
jgi:CHAT domain-containing protein/tetratricopeptide (TPR) repeat protein